MSKVNAYASGSGNEKRLLATTKPPPPLKSKSSRSAPPRGPRSEEIWSCVCPDATGIQPETSAKSSRISPFMVAGGRGALPGAARLVRSDAHPHRVGDLSDGIVERLPHRLGHGRRLSVADRHPSVECPVEEPSACRILQRDGKRDVGHVCRCEHIVEGEHVDVQRDC